MAKDDDDPTFPGLPAKLGDVKAKARAARGILDAFCVFLDADGGDSGERIQGAIKAIGDTVGDDGAKCLKDGDVVGCVLETVRNARKRKRR